MSEIWYQTRKYGERIRHVEVERHTQDSVWIGGRRRARITAHECVFMTWDAARAHLLSESERRLEGARNALQRAQAEHGNIKGMKPPSSAEAQNG